MTTTAFAQGIDSGTGLPFVQSITFHDNQDEDYSVPVHVACRGVSFDGGPILRDIEVGEDTVPAFLDVTVTGGRARGTTVAMLAHPDIVSPPFSLEHNGRDSDGNLPGIGIFGHVFLTPRADWTLETVSDPWRRDHMFEYVRCLVYVAEVHFA